MTTPVDVTSEMARMRTSVPESVEEVVEQRSDSDSLLHLWCLRCLRPSPLPNKAACGFTTAARGWGGPGDKCVVCLDLEGTPCEGCGWEL